MTYETFFFLPLECAKLVAHYSKVQVNSEVYFFFFFRNVSFIIIIFFNKDYVALFLPAL